MAGSSGGLSESQVKRIRKMAIAGETFKDIGDKFDIHMTHARSVAIGNSYARVEGPVAEIRGKSRKKKAPRIRKKRAGKKATKASTNGHVKPTDFTALTVDGASRFLQALSHEWPKVREAFLLLDSILTGEADDGS